MNHSDQLIKHIMNMILNSKDEVVNSITPNMFNSSDIIDVLEYNVPNHIIPPEYVISSLEQEKIFFVELRGINGTIPMRFFDKESQDKIKTWLKSRKSPLWEVLNEI